MKEKEKRTKINGREERKAKYVRETVKISERKCAGSFPRTKHSSGPKNDWNFFL